MVFLIFLIIFIVGLVISFKYDSRKGGYYDQVKQMKFQNQLEAVKHGATIKQATTEPKKEASVAKRAAAGAIIAGETGAIIGASSAINENLKNKDN